MNPRIRIIGKYGAYRIGDILSPGAMLRGHLLGLMCNGKPVAELVEESASKPANAVQTPPKAASKKKRQ